DQPLALSVGDGHALRVRQLDEEVLVAFGLRIGDDGDADRLRLLALGEGDRPCSVLVIAPRRRGPVLRGEVHRHRLGVGVGRREANGEGRRRRRTRTRTWTRTWTRSWSRIALHDRRRVADRD